MASSSPPEFEAQSHIRYWKRCYNNVLPHYYTANDSTRLTLGWFILSALDILSSPSSFQDQPKRGAEADRLSLLQPADRRRHREWILSLQHPNGGFCGSPNHVMPVAGPNDHRNANIAATVFALLSLGLLSDHEEPSLSYTYAGIDRTATLKWLKKLQRSDGSFGELLYEQGHISGGRDMRYCYIAVIIRLLLASNESDQNSKELDIDVEALVAHIRRGQTFDGGIAESSMHESHAGYAYCAVATLAILDFSNQDLSKPANYYIDAGIPSTHNLIRWLVHRQLFYMDSSQSSSHGPNQDRDAEHHDNENPLSSLASLSLFDPKNEYVGFNGRLNKVPDTCYAWWVAASLRLLMPDENFIDRDAARRFMLGQTQGLGGGFSKFPGMPPDVYHAYFGLGALSLLASNEDELRTDQGLGRVDPLLSIASETSERVRSASAFFTHIQMQLRATDTRQYRGTDDVRTKWMKNAGEKQHDFDQHHREALRAYADKRVPVWDVFQEKLNESTA